MTDESLRDAILGAMSEPSSSEPEPEAAVEPSEDAAPFSDAPAAPEQPGPARDETGRFKSKDQAAAPPKTAEGDGAAPSQPGPAAPSSEERIAPPQNWKGGAKVAWERLPKAVQQELIADYTRVTSVEQNYGGLQRVLEPRAQALSATYGSVENAVNQLFQLSDYADKDPRGFIQWFAQQRGIQLGTAQPQPAPTGQPARQPDPQAQVLPQIVQAIAQLRAQVQQAQLGPLEDQVKAFAKDTKNPYFNDVRQEMAALLESGRAKTLNDAYDMAVWANPVIRADLLKQQQETEAAERAKRAEAAKRAGTNITGSPLPGASTGGDPAPTLRGELERSFKAVGGRV